MTAAPPFPIRTECPPGSCVCERDALMRAPGGDVRILRLTREEEKRLLQRLEGITSLADLRHMEQRLFDQLGVRLTIAPGPREVRSLRGLTILVHEQPGLCRKILRPTAGRSAACTWKTRGKTKRGSLPQRPQADPAKRRNLE